MNQTNLQTKEKCILIQIKKKCNEDIAQWFELNKLLVAVQTSQWKSYSAIIHDHLYIMHAVNRIELSMYVNLLCRMSS